jgi:hypothetical protein
MRSGFDWMAGNFTIGVRALPVLLLSRRTRRALQGLTKLRRAYEHVLVMATLEGVRPVRRAYYQDYVDALGIIGARAAAIAQPFEERYGGGDRV